MPTFVVLKLFNKYLAVFLLAVFSFAMLPSHSIHHLFADHEDTEHGYCARYHSHLGVHVEKPQIHCEILKTNSPVYESPAILVFDGIAATLLSEINSFYHPDLPGLTTDHLPARGPPAKV